MNIFGAAVAVGIMLAIAGQGSCAAQGYPRVSVLHEADHGKAIDVPVGQSVEIHLGEGGGGYRWHAAPVGSGCAIVHDEGLVKTPSKTPGAPRQRKFRLEPTAPGECDVEIHSRRSWEHEKPPARTFRLHVRVTQ